MIAERCAVEHFDAKVEDGEGGNETECEADAPYPVKTMCEGGWGGCSVAVGCENYEGDNACDNKAKVDSEVADS